MSTNEEKIVSSLLGMPISALFLNVQSSKGSKFRSLFAIETCTALAAECEHDLPGLILRRAGTAGESSSRLSEASSPVTPMSTSSVDPARAEGETMVELAES